MPLPSRTLDISLSTGLSQKVESELVDPGQALLTASGLVHVKGGALQKPPGFTNLARTLTDSGATLNSAFQLATYRDEILLLGTETTLLLPFPSLFSYSSTKNAWATATTGNGSSVLGSISECVLTNRVPFAAGQILDFCLVNGFAAIVYSPGAGGQKVIFYDTATGSVVTPNGSPSSLPNGTTTARLASVGTKLFVLWVSGNEVVGDSLDTASFGGGWTGPTTITSTSGTVSALLDTLSGASAFYIAYGKTGGLPGGYVVSVNSSGTVTHTAGPVGSNITAGGLGGSDTDTIWFSFYDTIGGGLFLVGFNSSLATVATQATVLSTASTIYTSGVVATGTGKGTLVWGNDSGGVQTLKWQIFDTNAGATRMGGASSVPIQQHFRMVPVSKPFACNSRFYVLASYQTSTTPSTQKITALIDISVPLSLLAIRGTRPVVSISPRLAVTPGNALPQTAPVSSFVSGTTAFVANTITKSSTAQGIEIVTLDFANYANAAKANFLDLATFSGGTPWSYDGRQVAELGFMVLPELSSASAGGSGTLSGSYSLTAIYEWTDARGQIHRSAPAAPVVVSGVATKATLSVSITSLILSQRPTNDTLVVAVYATTGTGSTYYRIGTIANDPTSSLLSFTSGTITDNTISTGALLYTQPGTLGTSLPRVCPPSFYQMITHNDLLWGIDGINVWYTGQAVVGEGPWWSDAFQFPVLGGSGPLTGMASLDGHLILFKRTRVFIVDGRGAADNGSGNDLSNPSELPFEVGCTNPRSIVSTSEGVWFQSDRGLELLGRDLQVQPFAGQTVEDLIPAGYIVVSALVDEGLGKAYFFVRSSDSGGATGTLIVRDMVLGGWTSRTLSTAPRRAALAGSQYGTTPYLVWVDDTGVVHQETTSTYLDNGSWVTSTLETGWLKLAGVQGFQRVRKVYVTFKTLVAADVTVSVATDYSTSYTQSKTFPANAISIYSGGPVYTVSMMVGNQKCKALRIKIADATPTGVSTGTGQGVALLSIGVEYAVIPPLARLPASQKV